MRIQNNVPGLQDASPDEVAAYNKITGALEMGKSFEEIVDNCRKWARDGTYEKLCRSNVIKVVTRNHAPTRTSRSPPGRQTTHQGVTLPTRASRSPPVRHAPHQGVTLPTSSSRSLPGRHALHQVVTLPTRASRSISQLPQLDHKYK